MNNIGNDSKKEIVVPFSGKGRASLKSSQLQVSGLNLDDDVDDDDDDDDDGDDDDSLPFLLFFAFSRNVGRFRVNIIYAGDSDDADQT